MPRAHAPQEKPPHGEGSAPHEEQPLLPTTSNKDPTQPKINKRINKSKKKKRINDILVTVVKLLMERTTPILWPPDAKS